ncbi:hypothetical protein JMJ77_0000801 [Colletotrichum scovillei]|uniref:Uncharacterized protein n=1 Tax=Colletotrichum scovillei TaxID=1209932 RepID=A0A9P7RA32_9PEZI|nr:hypothetical protein JMJ77_0000801 [Colletotrichum scovillei]KAG7072013.1 hypothetical protein JMJ76_0004877 [Colletotrichum scovillei]KAG7080257.1 hypothetical protein JMJ78_0007356 [Colletotrichum scovillei]
MSDQVGFSFQADVVNTASLGHVLTGRLLKALSDGGVDTYAMWAAVQLGKRIPVQASHQSSLYAHIMSKKTYQSVLSKALSIGWGHSAPVADLARTVAGTNAIILIGAPGTGCQAFAAAQCLSEVMAIYGLEADMRPSVDVLKGLVDYLAPFTQNLGFSKVLQHITILAERIIRHDSRKLGVDSHERVHDLLKRLKDMGGATSLARAIKQLIHSAQKDQRDYMALKTRGSWLPAFASYVLGMSVEVRLNQTIVWASGGDHGHILFQLDDESIVHPTIHPFAKANGVIAPPVKQDYEEGSSGSSLKVDYLIGDALEAQFLKRPEIDDGLATSIRIGIKSFSFYLSRRMKLNDKGLYANFVNGLVDGVRALKDTLNKMGVYVDSTQQVAPSWPKPLGGPEHSFGQHEDEMGLFFLDHKAIETLVDSCPVHPLQQGQVIFESDARQDFEVISFHNCPCMLVGKLMYGFATTALALMLCNFDAAELRVQDAVIAGDSENALSKWMTVCHTDLQYHMVEKEHRGVSVQVKISDIIRYLGELICCDYMPYWLHGVMPTGPGADEKEILVLSGRGFTINYKCVMENESFDDSGRILRIQSGRASVAGAFRNIVVEGPFRFPDGVSDEVLHDINETADVVSLAGRTTLEPSHRPPETEINMDAFVQEDAISVRLNLAGKTSRHLTVVGFLGDAFFKLQLASSAAFAWLTNHIIFRVL